MKKEKDLCPECFKVVGSPTRYKLVKVLARAKNGLSVGAIARALSLTQPTATHHIGTLKELDAVFIERKGKEKIITLNKDAHCFDECAIPF